MIITDIRFLPFLSEGQCNHPEAHPSVPKPPCDCGKVGDWHPYLYTKFPGGKPEIRINEKEREQCRNSSVIRIEGYLQLRKRTDDTEFWWYQA